MQKADVLEAEDTSESLPGQAVKEELEPENPRPTSKLQKPLRGQIPGAHTYSVFRIRRHGITTRFELYEPSLGTQLVAKLERGSTSAYTITSPHTGEALGWMRCNVKGDIHVLYENLGPGRAPGPPYAAATFALRWRLSADQSRRVDAIRVDPDEYKPLPEGVAEDKSVSTSSDDDGESFVPERGEPAAESVPELADGSGPAEPEPEPEPEPTPGSLAARRRAKALRVNVGAKSASKAPMTAPGGGLPDRAASEIGESPGGRSPGSARALLGGLWRSLRGASSPQSSCSGASTPAELSPVPGTSYSLQSPAGGVPGARGLTLTSGRGGSEIVRALNGMMAQGLSDTQLPPGATAMRSARPKWDSAIKVHTLQFGGHVHKRSVKNLVLLSFEEGGSEVAHPELAKDRRGGRSPSRGGLTETLISPDLTYNEDVGRRVLIFGRHKSGDGSEFVCSHDPAALCKIQAFAVAIAATVKKAVYTYI
mmetsp:Transcript_18364/g.43921  ORF Transcript_18364/g.43921 Transcript_18364/m.43921 type:complete len:481 (-) Transcript_18364:345-1787(-)